MQRATRAQSNAARISCTVCHRRKVKCNAHDEGFPCSNCRNTPRESDCSIHQKRKRVSKLRCRGTGNTIPGSDGVLPLTPRLPAPPPCLDSSRTTAYVASQATSGPGQQDEQSNQHPEDAVYAEHNSQEENAHATPRTVTSLVGIPPHATKDGDFKRYLVEFIDQPQLTERPIDKDARIAYVGTDASNINFLLHQQFGSKTAGISHYPTNRIARRHTCHEEPDRLPVEAFQLPSKSVVDQLLEAYFSHVNPGFPVVDRDRFMDQYRARDPQDPPSLLLLHSMLLAGAHVLYDGLERESFKALFFRRAKILFDSRFERNRDTVVQASLLLAWHTDGAEDVLANAWFWVGIAIRTATGLGMHRDADGSTLVPHNKRMWRRVWWILVQCDVVLAMQYGRPLMIDLRESDVKPPQRQDFQDCGPEVLSEHCLQASELCVILARGMRSLLSLSGTPENRGRALRKTDEALANWLLRLSPALNPHSLAVLDPWAGMLHIQYNASLIIFHRQKAYAKHERISIVSKEDADICTAAAFAIQHAFQQLCEGDATRFLWISSVNCLFTALIQLSLEVRISNPVLAVSAFQRYESALASLGKLSEFWPNALSILHFFENSVRREKSGQLPDNEDRQPQQAPSMTPANAELQPGKQTFLDHEGARQDGFQERSIIVEHDLGSEQDVTFGDQPSTRHDLELSWKDWQGVQWQHPDLTDDFLFTF